MPVSAKLFGLHVLVTGAFFALTGVLYGRSLPPQGPVGLWLGAWLVAGLLSVTTLLKALLGDFRWARRLLTLATLFGVLVGVVAWLAAELSAWLWLPVSAATFRGTAVLLAAVGYSLEVSFGAGLTVIGLDGFRIDIAPVCSGIEGLGLVTVLMTGFLIQERHTLRFPRALLLLPLGILGVWLGNVVRIAVLMVLGARIDPELALGSFHSKAGWVFFCAITIGLALLAQRSRFFALSQGDEETEPAASVPWILPMLAWIAVSLVLSSFSAGHDPFYAARIGVSGYLLWHYRGVYTELLCRPSLGAWALGALVGAVWIALPTSNEPVVPLDGWSDAAYYSWLVTRTVGAVLIIPLCEELAFRGFLARVLVRRDFWQVAYTDLSPLAIIGSSAAFGLLHDRWLLATATGVAYALMVKHSGKLVDALAAHATSNAVIAVWVLVTQSWQYW